MEGPFLSRPVRDLPVVTQSGNIDDGHAEIPRPPQVPSFDKDGRRFRTGIAKSGDPLVAAIQVQPAEELATPAPTLNFAGIGNVDGVIPPDPEGAVGPDHYLQVVNFSFAVFDKAGSVVAGPVSTDTLWSGFGGTCGTVNHGGAIAMYDQFADRWVMSKMAISASYFICIAVSATPDPTGAWYLYGLETEPVPDYPKLGVWPDAVNNLYLVGTNTPSGGRYAVYAVDRASLLAGVPPRPAQQFLNNPYFLMPADVDGPNPPPTGSPGLFYSFRDGGESWFVPSSPVDTLDIYQMEINWDNPAMSYLALVQQFTPGEGLAEFIWTVCGFGLDCLPQPDTAVGLDSNSWWPSQRLVYRNFGTHETLLGTWTVDTEPLGDHAAPRWFELRRSGGDWSLHQQGTHAPDAAHRWVPSIAMDGSGNIALGYSVVDAGSGLYPSIRYATRLEGDPPGTLQAEQTLVAGSGSQTMNRWGSYSSMEIDPADDCTFWYTNEYLETTSAANWKTRIGAFAIPDCSGITYQLSTTPALHRVCLGSDAIYDVNAASIGGFSNPVSLSLSGHAGTVSFDPNPLVPPGASILTVSSVVDAGSGLYPLQVTGAADDPLGPDPIERINNVTLEVYEPLTSGTDLQQPVDSAVGVEPEPTFQWSAVNGATEYLLQVATDAGFGDIVLSTAVTGTSHTLSNPLEFAQTYHWRVHALNPCGEQASVAFSFTTEAVSCIDYANIDVPLGIADNSTTLALIEVASSGLISDLDVTLQGTHTYMGDLTFDLQSPSASSVRILDATVNGAACGNVDDFDLTLDDQAGSAFPCPPTGGGAYLPSNPLSAFNGEDQAGTWTLTISDNASLDTGVLENWTLYVCAGIVDSPPEATTTPATDVSAASATLNGLVDPNNSPAYGYFRYDTASPGTCNDSFGTRLPATSPEDSAVGDGDSPVAYSRALSGLAPDTTYHYCAIGRNAYGFAFGSVLSFTTDTYCNVNMVSGTTEYSEITHEACEILVLGPDFVAADGASVSTNSGWEIDFMPGFLIEQGATLNAKVCGQSLCLASPYPMPYGCHTCVDLICESEPSCCGIKYDKTCVDMVGPECGLVCE